MFVVSPLRGDHRDDDDGDNLSNHDKETHDKELFTIRLYLRREKADVDRLIDHDVEDGEWNHTSLDDTDTTEL